jgi:hypothetical protein
MANFNETIGKRRAVAAGGHSRNWLGFDGMSVLPSSARIVSLIEHVRLVPILLKKSAAKLFEIVRVAKRA